MNATLRTTCWAALACVGLSGVARADEPKPTAEEPKTEAAAPAEEKPADATPAEDITKLVKELDANRFSQRQAASEKLFEAGKAAIPALIEAAGQESREASTRSIDVLKRHMQGGEGELKTAAKEALEKIAAGKNETAARLAHEALNPKTETEESENLPGGLQLVPGGGAIQIGGGQIQIQVQGGIGGPGGFNAKRITMKDVNGVKEIEAVEGDRTVKINEDANGIKMEVTKKKDGKEATDKYEAKNLEELKKNHPDGAKLYEEYAQGKGGIKINGIQVGPGGALQLPAMPAMPAIPGIQIAQGQVQPVPAVPGKSVDLDKIRQQLDDVKDLVKKLGEGSNKTEELNKAIQQLEEAQKALEEATK